MKSTVLLQELTDITNDNIKETEKLQLLSEEQLNFKPHDKSWSILECIEHLNRYGRFYIPEIRERMNASTHKTSTEFKTGVLGDYFAKSMLPKEKLNKMKTFKNMNPNNSDLDIDVLNEFLNQQKEILVLLKEAEQANLTKIKTGITISNLIKLRLGDTFRVVIYHNLRHIVQAKKVLA